MTSKKILSVICACVFASQSVAKVYERCELARELVELHEIPMKQIASWICIVEHESFFNTSAVNRASGDHGLFQISNLYWCSPPGQGFACALPCSAFEDDDIEDDVICARRIFRAHQRMTGNGFSAWVTYNHHCRWDVDKYVKGCFDKLRVTAEKVEDDNEMSPILLETIETMISSTTPMISEIFDEKNAEKV